MSHGQRATPPQPVVGALPATTPAQAARSGANGPPQPCRDSRISWIVAFPDSGRLEIHTR